MRGASQHVIQVAAGVIVRSRRVLVCQRAAGTSHAGKWEFPGGKLESGESLEACLRRELQEELGIDATVGEVLWRTEHQYPERKPVALTFFAVPRYTGVVTNRIFGAIEWVPLEALSAVDFLEADRELVSALATRRMRLQPSAGSAGGSPAHRGWHSRGYLPHYDAAAVTQMVTYRLADALPREVIERSIRAGGNDADRRRSFEASLDTGLGTCRLHSPEAATAVIDCWRQFDGVRYQLLAWVVMPNHVHVMIEVLPGHPLDRTLHGWKSYTAKQINRISKASGRVWEPDYWDRGIRNQRHYAAAVEYVHYNPVKAGLVERPEDWPWSSAREHVRRGK